MALPPHKITELYAWIATNADGGEGIGASTIVDDGETVVMPMIGADQARISAMRPEAMRIKEAAGVQMRLVRFVPVGDSLETV